METKPPGFRYILPTTLCSVIGEIAARVSNSLPSTFGHQTICCVTSKDPLMQACLLCSQLKGNLRFLSKMLEPMGKGPRPCFAAFQDNKDVESHPAHGIERTDSMLHLASASM